MALSILEVGFAIIDKLIPDPQAKAQAQLDMVKLNQQGAFKEVDSMLQSDSNQTEVNKIEAASDDPFKSGWRPMAGWVCSVGLGYQFVAQPLLAWLSKVQEWPVPPVLDIESLLTLLLGMLGLGYYRTREKLK